jgi:hypothetical protein
VGPHPPIPAKTQVRADLIGTQVGRYTLEEKIGDGRNGAVYRGRPLDGGEPVAVKVTREAISERDVRAASHIVHAGIARVYAFGRLFDGRHWIAMELMEGEGLEWMLHRLGTLIVPETVQVLHQIADALDVAHQRSLLHGKLEASSVFLVKRPDGGFRVKLLDFGISPPEGSPEPSVDGDLHALGVLGFMMLTGQKEVPAQLPRPIAPVVPVVLDELVADLVQAASKLRPRTAAEVRAKLEPLRPLPRPPPARVEVVPFAAEPKPAKAARRVPAHVLAAVAGLAGVGGAVAALLWPSEPGPVEVIVAPPPPVPEAQAPVREPVEPVARPKPPKPRAASVDEPRPVPVPSEERLEERMDRLEGRLHKLPGERVDALHQLNNLRLRLSGVPDQAERREVARLLDAWEQTHLSKSHWQ